MFNVPVVSILVFPLLLLGPLFPVLPVSSSITMRLAIGVVVFSIVLLWYSKRYDLEQYLLYAGLYALLICLAPMIIKGYDTLFFTIVLSAGLGFIVFRYFKIPTVLLGVLLLLFLYFFLYYLSNGNLDEALYIEVYGQAIGASRNFVGIVLLQYYLIYYAVCTRNCIRPHHWPIYIMPVMGIMSSGVSSTVVAILLMIALVLIKLRVKLKHGLIALAIITATIYAINGWVEKTLLFDRITTGQFLMSRALLWSDFFYKLDANSILVGFPKDARFIDHEVSLNEIENLHNSYLNLYKRVGAFSFLYLGMIGYIAIALNKVNRILFIIYVATLIRAASDGYYFSSFLVDFILFYLLLLTPLGDRLLKVQEPIRSVGSELGK